ncbi:MAG: polysaccharide biosynthesis/export family protein [Candidatus Omnitrophota bacterium]
MAKKISLKILKNKYTFIAALLSLPWLAFAAGPMNPTVTTPLTSETVVVTTQGLSTTEQANVEQQNRFAVKGKSALLSPFLGGGETEEADETTMVARNLQEKLYRYFGIATELYQAGRLDEAVEILTYIAEKRPDDEYIKSYLEKITKERNQKSRQWDETAKKDAASLKTQKVKVLLEDGADYYKQHKLDLALVKFFDVLELDPTNQEAKSYIMKLKDYYLKEVRVEDIVNSYEMDKATNPQIPKEENSKTQSVPQTKETIAKILLDKEEQLNKEKSEQLLGKEEEKINKITKQLLDKKEEKVSQLAEKFIAETANESETSVKRMLDEQEMKIIASEKRMGNLLTQAELGLTIEDIVTKKKEDERRGNLYTLGAGDVLQIGVRDHPELSGSAVIRLDGEIVLPLVNEVVNVKDLTVKEVTQKISEAMGRFVKKPIVAVTIIEYKSKVFYVIDDIGCTPYPITRKNLTLRDALFISDWGDNRALGRVIVMKPDKVHPIVRKVDAFDLIYRGNLTQNVPIDNGDVIYVPLTIAAKITKSVTDTMQPFVAVKDIRDEWINLKGDQRSWGDFFPIHYRKAQDVFDPAVGSAP